MARGGLAPQRGTRPDGQGLQLRGLQAEPKGPGQLRYQLVLVQNGMNLMQIGSYMQMVLLGSLLQGVALVSFLFADGVVSLYLVSAMFGLFQGGIVPSYPLVVREYFTPKEAGARVGTVLMATLLGMALGGWMSGAIFDWTGSYRAAFVNGIAWNLLNLGIASLLLWGLRRRAASPVSA